MKKILPLLFILFSIVSVAQELNCQVVVNRDQVQGSDERVYQNMEKDIFEFMNSKKWTSDVYSVEERIECTFFITIQKRNGVDRFDASLQIQSSRPVFNSSLKTTLLNVNDQSFSFNYIEQQQMEFSINEYHSNLTAVLGYYAYIILAYDYDSFSLEGGTQFFQNAQTIKNNAQNSGESGWKAFDGTKNRYWLVENMLDPIFKPLRTCLYNYHRLGLDVMSDKIEEGRAKITEAIKGLEPVNKRKPTSYAMQVFFDAKSAEITSVYSEATNSEKSSMVQVLSKIDPAHSATYAKIMERK